MNNKLIFYAQSLDNLSPDSFRFNGEDIGAHDTNRIGIAASQISQVAKIASPIFEYDGVRLIADGKHFLIEVPCSELDEAGRVTAIVCCGDYHFNTGEEFAAAFVRNLYDFSKRIGRSLMPEHIVLARQAFSILKKRSLQKIICITALGAIIALAAITMIVRCIAPRNFGAKHSAEEPKQNQQRLETFQTKP